MKAHQHGEIKLTSFEEMMSELEADNIKLRRVLYKETIVAH